MKAEKLQVTLDGQPLPARHTVDQARVLITLAEPVEVKAGQTVRVAIS